MKNQSENKNSGIQYDAFISYRHVKTDSMVAEALHKKLEHYHIPKKLLVKFQQLIKTVMDSVYKIIMLHGLNLMYGTSQCLKEEFGLYYQQNSIIYHKRILLMKKVVNGNL